MINVLTIILGAALVRTSVAKCDGTPLAPAIMDPDILVAIESDSFLTLNVEVTDDVKAPTLIAYQTPTCPGSVMYGMDGEVNKFHGPPDQGCCADLRLPLHHFFTRLSTNGYGVLNFDISAVNLSSLYLRTDGPSKLQSTEPIYVEELTTYADGPNRLELSSPYSVVDQLTVQKSDGPARTVLHFRIPTVVVELLNGVSRVFVKDTDSVEFTGIADGDSKFITPGNPGTKVRGVLKGALQVQLGAGTCATVGGSCGLVPVAAVPL